MRTQLFLLLSLGIGDTIAQPGEMMERFINPCGFAPNDSVDVTKDGIPDLVIAGYRSGTDDEPSSSGNCKLHVVNLPGTMLYCGLDENGHRKPRIFKRGETILPPTGAIENDFQIPALAFTEGSIAVVRWGYGSAEEPITVTPGLGEQRYVFQTIAKEKVVRSSFTISYDTDTGKVRINTGTVVPVDVPLIVR